MKKHSNKILRVLGNRKASVFAEVLLLVLTLLSLGNEGNMFPLCMAFLALHSIFFVYILVKDFSSLKSPDNPLLSTMTKDFVISVQKPVVIVNKSGIISWYNDAFIEAAGAKSALYGKNIAEEISSSLNGARLFREKSTFLDITVENVQYSVSCHVTSSAGEEFCILLWDDISELSYTKSLLDSKSTLAQKLSQPCWLRIP